MPSKEVEHSRRCFHANISLGLQSAFSSLRGWLLWLLVAFPRMVFFFILPLTLSNCIHFCTKVTTGWFYLRSNKAWLVDPLNLFQNFIYCCFMVERRYSQLVLPEKYFFRSGDQIRWPMAAPLTKSCKNLHKCSRYLLQCFWQFKKLKSRPAFYTLSGREVWSTSMALVRSREYRYRVVIRGYNWVVVIYKIPAMLCSIICGITIQRIRFLCLCGCFLKLIHYFFQISFIFTSWECRFIVIFRKRGPGISFVFPELKRNWLLTIVWMVLDF